MTKIAIAAYSEIPDCELQYALVGESQVLADANFEASEPTHWKTDMADLSCVTFGVFS